MKRGRFTGLIHCFSTSQELAESAIDLGLYISLSGIITFNKSNELRNIIKELPVDRLLVETDAPYLAPEPYRGKCNEPAYVIKTAQFISNLLGISFESFAKQTTNNFYKLFTEAK
jgi:TatD DNase family protein